MSYIEHLLSVISTITRYVSISVFPSLVVTPIGSASSTIGLKICAIIAGIKNNKSIIQKKHDKIVLLAKSNLSSIEVLISKVVIDSNSSHDEFILTNNVLKKFYDMKKELKNSNNK